MLDVGIGRAYRREVERLHAVVRGDVQGVGFRYYVQRKARQLGLPGWVRNNDDPAHVFRNRRGMAPGTVYEANGKRIFVLPGVPLEMKGIFTEELEPQFLAAGSAATVRELRFTFAVEARFYPLMRELEGSFPDVSVGSYPNFETKELVIRVLGADPKRVDEALDVIRKRAPV